MFGPDYPVDEDRRVAFFSYSSLDTPMNDFDERMLEIAQSFGNREAFGKVMVAFIERKPALWQRIEGQRARLGETARLRYLNQALLDRLQMWGKPDVEAAPALAALPLEQRTLAALSVFNAEFENGGVHQFFYNSSGVIAPEVHTALREVGLERQAAIFKKGPHDRARGRQLGHRRRPRSLVGHDHLRPRKENASLLIKAARPSP
jgi:hypothetical protein